MPQLVWDKVGDRVNSTELVVSGAQVVNPGRVITFAAGELTVANHTFELKAKQDTAVATMTMYESAMSIRTN